ncbi:MAG: efflux RND transporter periplasmic adaptor subunit [Bacteroidales bacterium]|nr:efflux RND transporter periplasmic adaptor subunit [Bacteroidales bacterium]MCF8328527.1 efflux RND transporter periplasmic adaptor subunit [Bacteroidales bacterium]
MKRIKKFFLFLSISLFMVSCSSNDDKSDAYGNFQAKEITVSAQSQGELKSFDVTKGAKLKEGQMLGYIDTSSLHLQRKQLLAKKRSVKTRLNNLKAQINVQEQKLKNAKVQRNRIRKLHADNAATEQQLDDIKGKVKTTEKQIQSIEVQKQGVYAEMDVLDTRIALLEDKIDKAMIKNPVTGTVINKFVEKGELVAPGKTLYKVAEMDKMELKVYISGAQLPHVKIGQKVEVLIDENKTENRKLTGKVSWISDDAEFTPKVIQTKEERVKLVYAVKIRVPNDGSLKIGMPGEANF